MQDKSLAEVYASLDEEARLIYVVPLIRYSNKKSDYLYLLYKDLIESEKYEIQSVSVYRHFRLALYSMRNKHAILHYHWLEFQDAKSLMGMPWKIFCIWLFKSFGGKIVWTLHNEFPHDQKFMGFHSWLHKHMAKWADALHVHCSKAIPIMCNALKVPDTKFFAHPHPSFPTQEMDKSEAISKLNKFYKCEVEANVLTLLMFGNISEYKQIKEVAEMVIAFSQPCKLIIAGPIKKGHTPLYKELLSIEKNTERIKLIPRFIKEEHVPWFYNAIDACVFNYREILSSGGVHLAHSYKKKIIAPDKGCISAFSDFPNVLLFDDQEGLRKLLEKELNAKGNEQA